MFHTDMLGSSWQGYMGTSFVGCFKSQQTSAVIAQVGHELLRSKILLWTGFPTALDQCSRHRELKAMIEKKINTTFLMSSLYAAKKIIDVLGDGQILFSKISTNWFKKERGRQLWTICSVAAGVWECMYAHACVCAATYRHTSLASVPTRCYEVGTVIIFANNKNPMPTMNVCP